MKPIVLIRKIAFCLLVCAATLAYLEVGVRVLASSAFPLLRTDPDVGSIHVRNYKGLVWDGDSQRKNYIITNNLGYIGRDYELLKPTSTVRISVLGDSVVAGLQVDYSDNFTSRLETAWNVSGACGKGIEVMNFGVGGSGTFLQYQTYKKYVSPFKPDIVLVVFHDDFDDNMQKANFDPENYAAERKAVGLKSFLLNFQFPKFVFSKLQSNANVIGALKALGIFESAGSLPAASGEALESGSSDGQPQSYFDITFSLISRFNERVKADGGKLVVLVYPSERDYASIDAWKSNERLIKISDFLSQSGIESINPSNDLAQAKMASGRCLTFGCTEHLDGEGQRRLAAILFDYFRKNYCP